MEEIDFIYETKCSRCNTPQQWFVSRREYDNETFYHFQDYMKEKTSSNDTYPCSSCKEDTIQSVIGWAPSPLKLNGLSPEDSDLLENYVKQMKVAFKNGVNPFRSS